MLKRPHLTSLFQGSGVGCRVELDPGVSVLGKPAVLGYPSTLEVFLKNTGSGSVQFHWGDAQQSLSQVRLLLERFLQYFSGEMPLSNIQIRQCLLLKRAPATARSMSQPPRAKTRARPLQPTSGRSQRRTRWSLPRCGPSRARWRLASAEACSSGSTARGYRVRRSPLGFDVQCVFNCELLLLFTVEFFMCVFCCTQADIFLR